MANIRFPHLFESICSGFVILAAIAIIPIQVFAATRYVASGGSCGASPCYSHIQDAVDAAVNGDEIRVAAGTYSQTSTGADITSVVRIYNKKITLKGGYTTSDWNNSNPTANPTVIDANENGIGIFIKYQADTSYGNIIINGFSITDCSATEAIAGTDSGGGIFIDHTTHVSVTIQNCKIYDNVAEDGSGGGIRSSWSDNLQVNDSEISDNQGSAVTVTYGRNLAVVDSIISNNVGDGIKVITDSGSSMDIRGNEISGQQGSGVFLQSVSGGSMTDNLISNNHTTGGGGGLDISGAIGNFLISGNTITGNSSMQGGGIDISGSIAEISENLIESNFTTASSNGGGGMYVNAGNSGSSVLVSNNRILSNTTSNQGGGILVLGFVDVLGNTVTGNTAYSGGGILATATGIIADNVITGNSARSGGGIRTVNPSGGLTIQRNQVMDNHATNGNGGGMELWGGWYLDITLDGNQVISNTATGKGGGIYIEGPSEDPEDDEPINISNMVLAKNIAATGSGLYSTVCELNLAYTTVASNRHPSDAWGDGRGLYLRFADETPSYNIINSIVVDQEVGIYIESGSASIESTLWGSGTWANDADTGGSGTIDIGTNNDHGAPVFISPTKSDYHIGNKSPAIDKGADTWISIDMDNESRPAGATDIGADEYTGPPAEPHGSSLPFLLLLLLD